jgi:hypothetical protein
MSYVGTAMTTRLEYIAESKMEIPNLDHLYKTILSRFFSDLSNVAFVNNLLDELPRICQDPDPNDEYFELESDQVIERRRIIGDIICTSLDKAFDWP